MSRLICCGFATFCCLLALVGCGRKVEVVSPDTSIHLSGMWNDDDSRSVSQAMINQCVGAAWIGDFRERTGRKPIVRVSQIVNASKEDIATQIFTNDLERALINSATVRVVASRDEAAIQREERADVQANSQEAPASQNEQAPDFFLQGSIRIQHDSHEKNQVKFYQVDLKMVDSTTNESVWIGTDERKKVVED